MKPGKGSEQSHHPSRPSGLTGWSAVEDYMQGNDWGMMKDYADDVDTLLVFAGLFSAVLSAFLVISFALLQIDNSQTTVDLLTRITLQLDNQHSTTPTVLPLPDPSSFRPTQASLWVNTLWFVSLVLSLAAAFFGILIKQWLREYLKWNSPLSDPKENVLVRQIRFEAWKDWGVDGTIMCIPILLEISLVLFFAGLEVLLWTVESVVAIVATIFISLFFGCAAAATILPLYIKRCPYKSPTTYSILVFYHLSKTYFTLLLRSAKTLVRTGSIQQWSDHVRRLLRQVRVIQVDWRTRDILGSHLRVFVDSNGRSADASTVFSNELQVHLRGTGSEASQVLLEMGKAETLLRALSWVARASQDKQILANVASSAETLHAVDLPYDIRYLSTVHLLSRTIGGRRLNTIRGPLDVLVWLPTLPDYALPKLDGTISTLLEVLRLCYHMPETRARRVGGHLAVNPHQGFGLLERTWYSKGDWVCTRLDFHIFVRLLVGDIEGTIFELVRLAKSRPAYVEPVAIGCRVMGLLCALHRLIRAAQFQWPELQVDLFDGAFVSLINGYNGLVGDAQANSIDEAWCPGLRTSLVATIYTFVDVFCDASGKLFLYQRSSLESPASSIATADLVVSYKNALGDQPLGREDCSCLVAITNRFLSGLVSVNIAPDADWLTINTDRVHAVVDTMIIVAKTSLERGYTNCGSYTKLPWLSTFTLRNFWMIAPAQLDHLLDIMERCDQSSLLTGEVKEQLARAREVVAYFETSPEEALSEDMSRSLQDEADPEAASSLIPTPSDPTSGATDSTLIQDDPASDASTVVC